MTAAVLIAAGLLAAALATAAGRAAVTVSRAELARWVSRHLRGAEAAASVLLRPREVMAAASITATVGVIVSGLGFASWVARAPWVGTAVGTLLLAIPGALLLVHVMPRAAARRWPETFFRRLGPFMRTVYRFCRPFLPPVSGDPRVDLEQVFEDQRDEALADDLRVVSGIVQFAERQVRHVMTQRTAIVAIEEGAPIEEVSRVMSESGFTRVPVYRDSLDNIIGMIHAFDLLKLAPGDPLPIRETAHVVGNESLRGLLLRMQRERRHMAVVMDEFGGTEGVVTLDDLLGELVAELYDEVANGGESEDGDDAMMAIEVQGGEELATVEARFAVTLPGTRAETVGGYLAAAQGRIPAVGDRFTVAGLEFDVLEASPRRLERVVVRRAPRRVVGMQGRGGRNAG